MSFQLVVGYQPKGDQKTAIAELTRGVLDGEKHQVVWIDGRGVIAAFQTQENGQTINFVLKSDTAEDEATARLPEP